MDVIREAQYKGDHTRVVQISHRYGMILFIASEVMFFVAWFWAFFNSALFPADAVHAARDAIFGCGAGTQMGACAVPGTWPPKGIEAFDPWHLPLLNTLLLLTSGTTVTWAHHALLEGDRQGLKYGLWLTIALGVCFTCVQAYEYSHALFGFSGNVYGATFFMATGFHGFHVLLCRALHADPAPRLRIRCLVLAFRRRGVAVPVCLHLRLEHRRRPAGRRRVDF
jgi:cytochrome c oxidase subunit 3